MNRFGLRVTVAGAVSRLLSALVMLALAGLTAFAQTTVLEVIPLRYRTAEQVIPLIRPMVGAEGSVSGFQGQLIVRAMPANLEEIKRVLASLDTAPRRLLVTVTQDFESARREHATEISGSVGSDGARVVVPGSRDPRGGNVVLREGDDRLRARAIESQRAEGGRSTQSVQVIEGSEAFVRVGQSVPLRERQVRRVVVGGQVVEQVVESTQYRDVTTGFYVLPRVSGDIVTLQVSPQRESLSREVRGAVNIQRVVTTVSGRLGEWMEIGSLAQDSSGQQSVLLGRSTTGSAEARRVLIKVDELK